MRSVLVKTAAVVLCLFYLASIVGVDVHSDHESGRNYVRLVIFGTSCTDIHPDSPCHHNHTDGCGEDEDCCSDDIVVLSITGDNSSSDDLLIPSGVSFCAVTPCCSLKSVQSFRESVTPLCPPGGIPPKILLHEICIMRV